MPSNYTGSATAAETPSSAPGPGVAPILALPVDADALSAASTYQPWKTCADFIAYLTLRLGGAAFGDGSDGTVTLDGTVAAPAGLTKVGNVYTANRDLFFDNLTVSGASTKLDMNNYRLFVRSSLTTSGGAFIHNSGNDAVGGAGGTAKANGTLVTAVAGGVGGTVGTGATGSSCGLYGYGGVAGAGGAGAAGAAGSGGIQTAGNPTAGMGSVRSYTPSTFGYVAGGGTGPFTSSQAYLTALGYGAGGGGGGGGGPGQAGGGGAGGGILAVAARNVALANAPDVRAFGGNGANAVGSNAGGGGGGGGGTLLLVYGTLTISSGALSAATNCAGGSAGTGLGTGLAGSAGANGTVFAMQPV